jgi:16S rRNA (guanine(966)-N(2))-methyltransferase RsmD
MLRVIAGTARGRRLKGPGQRKTRSGKDAGTAQTRPTSDLIRGVIFNMLDAMGADYTSVLDLYAGTGALGIEALSRGDGDAVFVESDAGAIAVIRDNLRACGFEDRAQVLSLTTERVPQRLADLGPYTLILADPPYYDEAAPAAVAQVASSSLAGQETVFVYEHHRSLEPPGALGPLPLYRSRRHGDTVVSIYAGEPALDHEVEDMQ